MGNQTTRIAIVGNGPTERDHSALIDSCDTVFRMNKCGSFGKGTGTKLDKLVICNTVTPLLFMAGHNGYLGRTDHIWLSHHPAYLTFLADYQKLDPKTVRDYASFARKMNPTKTFTFCDPVRAVKLFHNIAKKAHKGFVAPSTGAILLHEVFENIWTPNHEVFMVGFTHKGWKGHPWDAERALAQSYIDAGKLVHLI